MSHFGTENNYQKLYIRFFFGWRKKIAVLCTDSNPIRSIFSAQNLVYLSIFVLRVTNLYNLNKGMKLEVRKNQKTLTRLINTNAL